MATSVRLDDEFVARARAHAEAESRSVAKQIEYGAKIGRTLIFHTSLCVNLYWRPK